MVECEGRRGLNAVSANGSSTCMCQWYLPVFEMGGPVGTYLCLRWVDLLVPVFEMGRPVGTYLCLRWVDLLGPTCV